MPPLNVVFVVLGAALAAWLVVRRARRGSGEGQSDTLDAPRATTPESLRALLDRGEKIEAIKQLRLSTGLGLQAARDAIQALERGEPPTWLAAQEHNSPAALPVKNEELERRIAAGQVIEAIKLYRELHGVGLKEAKDAVDALRVRPPR